jgi:hypothetical protein
LSDFTDFTFAMSKPFDILNNSFILFLQ